MLTQSRVDSKRTTCTAAVEKTERSEGISGKVLTIVGFVLVPALWITVKQFGLISDRYLLRQLPC